MPHAHFPSSLDRDIGQRQATLVVDAPQLAALAFLTLTGQGAPSAAVPDTIDVIEFHNSRDGQYSSQPIRVKSACSTVARSVRTGRAPARRFALGRPTMRRTARLPVCRFFGTPGVGPNSHFYTAYEYECAIVRTNPNWIEEGVTFRRVRPFRGRAIRATRPYCDFGRPTKRSSRRGTAMSWIARLPTQCSATDGARRPGVLRAWILITARRAWHSAAPTPWSAARHA